MRLLINTVSRLKRFLPARAKLYLRSLYLKHIVYRNVGGAASVDLRFWGAIPNSDISEHLSILYFYLAVAQPANILELGTRGGESTKVLEKYCQDMNIIGHSFDLDSAPDWLSNSKHWKHFIGDDISMGRSLTVEEKWPDNSNFHKLDFIFLDTSHEYSHTLAELKMYIPLLNRETGAIALHDTNLTQAPTRRLDGRINHGYDNKRGVTRALEDYFNFSFNESSLMSQPIPGSNFLLYHQPWNNGLSILIAHAKSS